MGKKKSHKKEEHNSLTESTRRDFIKNMVFGGGAVVLFGNLGLLQLSCQGLGEEKRNGTFSMIFVDYSKCTGCRTCEAVCSSFNQALRQKEELIPGLGNPYYSNIKVWNYNPDVDVPSLCSMCPDSPCIVACPVTPDPVTGRKALYRDDGTGAIRNDRDRCIGCGSCAEACRAERAGVIVLDTKNNKPQGMCTLCGGEPQCIEHCPYDALQLVKWTPDNRFTGMPPDRIAEELIKTWYHI